MENDLADLSLEYGEKEVLLVQGESKSQNVVVDFCLVRCFLMATIVHFPVMNSNMVNIWHLNGEDPVKVLLVLSTFWVKVYELPQGLFSEFIAKELGDFIGKFMEYDSKILSRDVRTFLRIRVQLDVRRLLKQEKKDDVSIRKKRMGVSRSNLWYSGLGKESGEVADFGLNGYGTRCGGEANRRWRRKEVTSKGDWKPQCF
ncbi:hypothetical protein Godav_024387 [Gossypium davidsonii]|uniref:DUF4283 domain-containing protein n=1 Tax=Gossypium davidsonii TaxID=34287 RepID=A0A7J8TB72_GOSDV|nr:hypothetical protein [Gossypium davidsonii]